MPLANPDNWLVARLWFNRGYGIVETMGVPIRGNAPHIFYADGPKSRMNYAVAIESEGILDEKAEYAWKQSIDEWKDYGDRQVPTSEGLIIQLNAKEAKQSEVERLTRELDKLLPGVRDKLLQAKLAELTASQRKIYEMPIEEIEDPEDFRTHFEAIETVFVSAEEVAKSAPQAVQAYCNKLTGSDRGCTRAGGMGGEVPR